MRLGALLCLLGVFVLLPFDPHARVAENVTVLGPVYGWFLLLPATAYVLATTRLGRRYAGALALGLVLGYIAGILAYVAFLPTAPALTASAIAWPLLAAVVFYGWGTVRTGVVCTLAWLGFAVTTALVPSPTEGNTMLAAAALLAVWAGVTVVIARLIERQRDRIAHRERELGTLSERLMAVQEDERRLLAHELHDGVGQSLTALLSYFWLI